MRTPPESHPDTGAIPWDDAPESGRDRSLAARLGRAIEAGVDEIEPGNQHLADVRAWLAADSDRGDVRLILADLALLDPLTFDEVRPAVAKGCGRPGIDARRRACPAACPAAVG